MRGRALPGLALFLVGPFRPFYFGLWRQRRRSMMDSPARIAAVDVGRRSVGVAVTDPLRMFARAVGTFVPPVALSELQDIHAQDGIDVVVVGWPLEEDGSEGEAVRRTKPFISRLRKALPGVEIQVQDERFSTRRAREALIEHGVPRQKRLKAKGRVDAAAAAIILQDWLEDAEGGSG